MEVSFQSKQEKLLSEENHKKIHQNMVNLKNKLIININESNKLRLSRNKELTTNRIETSKYNWINFIPKILYEQFSKVGNLYFLFLAILQVIISLSKLIPEISASSGTPVILLPLSLVITINGFKDFFEDMKRKSSDNRENKSHANVIKFKRKRDRFIKTSWDRVKLGQIVKIEKGDYFPCDLLLIYSSNKNGVAYVETKNLDGETNLKFKEAPKEIYKDILREGEKILEDLTGKIVCDRPNAHLYEFNGIFYFNFENKTVSINEKSNLPQNLNNPHHLHINSESYEEDIIDPNQNFINLDYKNFLLRGCSLRNTDFIYGIAIYPGHQTKIMLNSINARSKNSRVTNVMNSQLMVVVLIQFIISFSFALLCLIHRDPFLCFEKDVELDDNHLAKDFIYYFLAWVLTLSNMVPISLLVKLEMIRFCQAIFISWDYKMFDIENFRSAIVQTSGLNEELGQIHYIFTDKTGTLTKNVMQFRNMIIEGNLYGTSEDMDFSKLNNDITNVNFNDEKFFKDFQDPEHEKRISDFLFSLALCHTIIISENQDGHISYNASSPDELALVNAARYLGCFFRERTDDNEMIVRFKENNYKFKLLRVMEFNSNRKRMSVIVQEESGQKKLICKGADSVILKRLDMHKSKNVELTMKNLEKLGEKGLRTLMIAERNISDSEYAFFKEENKKASLNLDGRKEKIDETYEILEKELVLLGATAIEDCLQDDLKQTLKTFRHSGIKLWMLTGDNALTAVSIAHSCGLITKRYLTSMITETHDIEAQTEKIKDRLLGKALKKEFLESEKLKHCFVMTGDVLGLVLNDNAFRELRNDMIRQKLQEKGKKINDPNIIIEPENEANLLFLKKITGLMIAADVFIASRVSPKQKADLIKLVKILQPEKGLLGIGDGANDVNMITTADVGIGIMGNEGQQAARASDYIIGKFSYLRRLMYVHGREAYRKNSYTIGYVLWKNFLYIMPMMCLGFFSNYSGQNLYDPFVDTLYNILFTAYPIGWFAVYDKEDNYDKLETNSEAYKIGMEYKCFNFFQFWKWYLYAFITSLIIFFYVFFGMSNSFNNHLLMWDIWTIGVTCYFNVVFVVNLKLVFSTNTHNVLSLILFIFSNSSFLIVIWLTSKSTSFSNMGTFDIVKESVNFYLMNIYIIVTAMLVEYGYSRTKKILSDLFKPLEKVKVKHEHLEPEDLERRYTGFAFDEDVSNLRILLSSLKEDYFN